MIFTTRRLFVRKAIPSNEDVDLFFRLWNDARVMVNVGFPNGLSITRDKIIQMLEAQKETEYDRLLVIERRPDGERLGECKLGKPDDQGVAETDVKLLPEFWRHRYGLEVKRGLLDYLFTHTECRAVQATPNVSNLASIRMQEAVGGQRISERVYEFPENMREHTQPVHHYIYQVTRQAWEALPPETPSSMITIQIRRACDLAPEEQLPLNDLLLRVFQDDPFSNMAYAKADWNVLAYLGNILASSVEIMERTIKVDECSVRVGGISGVATLPELRGRGLASRAVLAATQFIKDKLGLEYALLTTGNHRQTFYQALGWQTISEPAFFDQPSGKIKNGGLTMVLSLVGKPWPHGEIDFCGLPW